MNRKVNHQQQTAYMDLPTGTRISLISYETFFRPTRVYFWAFGSKVYPGEQFYV
jgi:hypothetical protein